MRRELKERGVGYFVAKKTLIRRALSELKELKISGEQPELLGEVALAYLSTEGAVSAEGADKGSKDSGAITDKSDSIAPARGINEFAKMHKGNISILGGIFEESLIGKDKMKEIAAIPSLETLYGQFVNIINSPIQGLVVALNEVAKTRN